MNVSLVIACSQQYEHHLYGYVESVRNLNRQPDEIVVVTDNAVPDFDCTLVRVNEPWNLGAWYNKGFAAASGDWIVWTGADDRFKPHALDKIDACQSDVLMFGLDYSTGQKWTPGAVTAEQVLKVASNLVPCGSPVRRELWEGINFNPDLYPFDDWGFWVGCAFQGATFEPTNTLDIDYAHGPEHLNPPLEPTRSKIVHWLTTLEGSHGNR